MAIRQLRTPVDLLASIPKTGEITPYDYDAALRGRLNPINQMGPQANEFSNQQANAKQAASQKYREETQRAQYNSVLTQMKDNGIPGSPVKTANGKWVSPVGNIKESFGYGVRYKNPGLAPSKDGRHHGIDFAGPVGSPIYAPAAATLLSAGWGNSGFGNEIRAQFGQGGPFGIFGHLSKFAPGLKPGMQVTPGQLLGYMGGTGNATGSHLHFELRKILDQLNSSIDPSPYFGW